MLYYKWIYSNQNTLTRPPGFVFCDPEDAQIYRKQYSDWISGQDEQSLFTFEGPAPKPFPILLSGTISYSRTKEYRLLNEQEFTRVLDNFARRPIDFLFYTRFIDYFVKLFLDVCYTATCLKPIVPNPELYGHSGIEAYYARPVVMTRIGRSFARKSQDTH